MPYVNPVRATRPAPTLVNPHRETWEDRALCAQADPELFFPDKGQYNLTRTAKEVCARCPVQAECLEFALADPHITGVWGGTTEIERRSLRRSA